MGYKPNAGAPYLIFNYDSPIGTASLSNLLVLSSGVMRGSGRIRQPQSSK
ncbi:hypothetical protein CCP3SC1_1930002 [Gammaproteobacteria bacterium]